MKWSLETFYRPFVIHYLKKDREYRYRGVEVVVRTGVFHPGLFFSTKILFDFLERIDLRAKTFLEVGAGSGLLSIRAAQRGAAVVALDISRAAVDNLAENAERNGVSIRIVQSDLFSELPKQRFDVIVVNPPFYPNDPTTDYERAWYCGSRFEFFEGLFRGLRDFIGKQSLVFMLLSQDCRVDKILELSVRYGLTFGIVHETRALWEKNYIFRLRDRSSPTEELGAKQAPRHVGR